MQLHRSTRAPKAASATKTAKSIQSKGSKVVKPVKKAAKKAPVPKTSSGSAASSELQVGDTLPSLTLLNQDEEEVNMLKLAKKADVLVIFVYPRASTPGCTRQACGFRDNYSGLSKLGATVVGLSADSPSAQTKFKERQHLQYDLLCDPQREFIALLGCKKQPKGIIRSHYVFKDGVLKFKRVKISPEQSYTDAVTEVKELL